jgi:dihydroorotate dehydrogenase (fumarate)
MHTDVTTTYMGMRLRSPIIVGACPLTRKPETVRELSIAGAGAVVLPSLFEEQIVRDTVQHGGVTCADERRIEAAGSARLEDSYNGGVDAYLRSVRTLKKCTGIPIIASLNGCAHGKWLEFVTRLEAAGADAIELSIHTCFSDPGQPAQTIEDAVVGAIEAVCHRVSIPTAVKLLPFFTSLPHVASRLASAGAAGVVLFGREPIWDVLDGEMSATSRWSLSDSGQLQTTLSGLMRVRAGACSLSVAASGGIVTAKDVIHCVIAGANTVMVTSEIYRNGPDVIAHLLEGVTQYLQRQGIPSFESFVSSCRNRPDGRASRQSQVKALLDVNHYRDPRPETISSSDVAGDAWGHACPTPLED